MIKSSIRSRPLALLFALLVHLILVGLLWWGATWQQKPPTSVELWDAASLKGSPVAPSTEPAPVPVVVNETPPSVVTNVETPVQAKPAAEIEVKPQQTVKPAPQPAQKPSPTKPSAPNKAVEPNKAERNAVLGNAGKSSTSSNNSATGNVNKGNAQAYIGRLQSAIERAGNGRGLAGLRGRVTVRVSPNGNVSVQNISGLPADKAAILRQAASVSVSGPPAEVIGQSIGLSLVFR